MKIQIFVIALLCLSFFMCTSDTATSKNEGAKVTSSELETGWYYVVDDTTKNAIKKRVFKSKAEHYLLPEPIITAANIQTAESYEIFGKHGLKITLDEKGIARWAEGTERSVRKYIGFVMDNELLVTQRISAKDNYGNASIAIPSLKDQEFQEVVNKIKALAAKNPKPSVKKN